MMVARFRGLVQAWLEVRHRLAVSFQELRCLSQTCPRVRMKRTPSVSTPSVSETLVQAAPAYAKVAAQGPVRVFQNGIYGRQSTRHFTTFTGYNLINNKNYQSYRYKTKFFHQFHTRTQPILSKLKTHLLFHNFSQAYNNSYRLKMYQQLIRWLQRTFFNRLRRLFGVELSEVKANLFVTPPVLVGIRLHQLLTPGHHKLTLELARTEAHSRQVLGCYLEFRLDCPVGIPNDTMYTEETQAEIKSSFARQRQRLAVIEENLDKLAELGEVPITCNNQVIRFYFPNCDRERLQNLLAEREITGGVIVEDYESNAATIAAKASESVSEWDVMSLSGYQTLLGSLVDDDVLSSESSMLHHSAPLVTLDALNAEALQRVEIATADEDYHWI